MSRVIQAYLVLLGIGIAIWGVSLMGDAAAFPRFSWTTWGLLFTLYGVSQLLRMLRLALLTLDRRAEISRVVAAHALTAFPSIFLPFKLGEVLRLSSFIIAFKGGRRAYALWLSERFFDVTVIALLIMTLSVMNVGMPEATKVIFRIFFLISIFGLLTIFAITRVMVYLNRHLVLVSHSAHGLLLLKASHWIRLLEAEVRGCIQGRSAGLVVCSVAIWSLEIAALINFMNYMGITHTQFGAMFATVLMSRISTHSLQNLVDFGSYQSVTLAVVALVAILAICLSNKRYPGGSAQW